MNELTRDEALQILESAPVAHLGVLADDGVYVTPMSFVVEGDRILFRTMPGRKYRAMKDNPRVCVEVSDFDQDTGDWVSVIVIGQAQEATDRRTGELAVQLLLRKYSDSIGSPLSRSGLQPMAGLPHVVEVAIEEVSGMTSGRGVTPRTRPGRL